MDERLDNKLRLTPRRRTAGNASATLFSLADHFHPVIVEVMDVSAGGVGVLLPKDLPLCVGDHVDIRLPLKPSGYKPFRMEVRWIQPGDLFDTAGLAFL